MKIKSTFLLALSAITLSSTTASAALLITGIIDGGLTGGTPKAIELFATTDIADLSVYEVDNANNGGAAFDGTTIVLSGSITAGSFLYVASESTQFEAYFGFAPDFTGNSLNVNGDDVVGLFLNETLVDVYGVLGVSGGGTDWDYLDSFAYRIDGNGPSATFDISEWDKAPTNTTDGTTTAEGAGFPTGTYAVPEPSAALLGAISMLGLLRRRR